MSLYDSTSLYDDAALSFDGYAAPLANMPAVGVFIAWTGTPYEVDPTGGWTDVTRYVRQITIRRGRQDDLQQFPPGTAQLVLDNNLRYFDPFNTASPAPFNGNIVPRKQIKIVANWNGTEYPLYRGYVAGWPVEYTEGGLDSTVTIDCFDLIGLLGATTFDPDRYRSAVRALNPVNYWTFNELSSTQSTNPAIADLGSRNTFPLQTDLTTQSIGSQVARGVTSNMFNPDGYLQWTSLPGTLYPETTDFSVSFWGKTYEGRTGYMVTFYTVNNNPGGGLCLYQFTWSINYSPAQVTNFGLNINLNGAVSESNRIFADDQPHHVVVTYQRSVGQARIWIDGVDQTVVKATVTNNGAPFPAAIFSWRDTVVYPGGSGRAPTYGKVGISQLAFFDKALSSTEIQDLYQAGFGFKNESSANRVMRYMQEHGIPSGFYNVTSSPTTNVGDFVTNSRPLIDALTQIVDTEGGELYVNAAGVLQFTNRNGYFTGRSATSQVTFTDTGVGVEYDASGVRMGFDADRVRNSVAISTPDGFNAVASSAASIAQNGEAGESLNTAFVSNADAQTYADYFVSIYKNPKLQVEPFMSKGQADPSYNWPRLLGLELLDRVTFKRTPSVGSAVQRDLLVQSLEHRITPGEWQTVVNGSTRYTGWFILGVSLLGSSEDVLL